MAEWHRSWRPYIPAHLLVNMPGSPNALAPVYSKLPGAPSVCVIHWMHCPVRTALALRLSVMLGAVCRWEIFWQSEAKTNVIPFVESLDRQYKYYT